MKKAYLLPAVVLTVLMAGCIGPQYPTTLTQDDINQTASVVSNSDSITLEETITTDGTEQRLIFQYNNTTQRVLFTQYVDGKQVSQRYITENREYRWDSGSPTFGSRDASQVSPEHNRFTQPLTNVIIIDEPIERTGTTTYNGNRVAVYNTTDEHISIADKSLRPEPAENATVTLYATNSGHVTYAEYETNRGGVTASITEPNETHIERPSWVDNARETIEPPRLGTTLRTDTDNETVTVRVTDPGNADTFSVLVDGNVMRTVDGTEARVKSPTTETTLTLDLSTNEYDATDGRILVVAENDGLRGIVNQYQVPSDN